MIATLLGVPIEERDRLMNWSNIFSNPDNPEIVASPAVYYDALAELGEFFVDLWNARARAETQLRLSIHAGALTGHP